MEDEFLKLSELGAGELKHINGSLLEHLRGTKELLRLWGASEKLQIAGSYHAVYGTDGYSEKLISPEHREDIANIIGEEAEKLVYEYCACDRKFFLPKIGVEEKPFFKNRFNNETYYLDDPLFKDFCELSVANEIEIAVGDKEFIQKHGAYLKNIFINMKPFLSNPANSMVQKIFGAVMYNNLLESEHGFTAAPQLK